MWPSARPSKPCCAAATCSVFRMSNLTTYLVLLSLPMPQELARLVRDRRGCRRARTRLSSGPRFERSSTWKLALDSSTSPKSAMLFAVNFCRNVALLLLISPGMHDQRRALLVRVRVLDRLVDRLVGRRRWPAATCRCPRSATDCRTWAARARATRRRRAAARRARTGATDDVRLLMASTPCQLRCR